MDRPGSNQRALRRTNDGRSGSRARYQRVGGFSVCPTASDARAQHKKWCGRGRHRVGLGVPTRSTERRGPGSATFSASSSRRAQRGAGHPLTDRRGSRPPRPPKTQSGAVQNHRALRRQRVARFKFTAHYEEVTMGAAGAALGASGRPASRCARLRVTRGRSTKSGADGGDTAWGWGSPRARQKDEVPEAPLFPRHRAGGHNEEPAIRSQIGAVQNHRALRRQRAARFKTTALYEDKDRCGSSSPRATKK